MRNRQHVRALLLALTALWTFCAMTRVASAASSEQVIHSFNYNDGTHPYAGLVMDSSGNLYGTTNSDGIYGGGTVFQLIPNGNGQWGEQVLYNFCAVSGCADGGLPTAAVVLDTAGNLYGTTSGGGNSGCGHGCGTVFQLAPGSEGTWTETVLYTFSGGRDGGVPVAGLVLDKAGNLYGTTSQGGSNTQFCGGTGCGVAFKLKPGSSGTWTQTLLHTFCKGAECKDGAIPNGLVADADGHLYGTTRNGGPDHSGTAFRLTKGKNERWTAKALHNFGKGTDGATPAAGLVLDLAGNLYGTTSAGGAHAGGTVFKLIPTKNGRTWTEKILYAFCSSSGCGDGILPEAALIFDATGNLYGTTYYGGTYGSGTVFELTPGGKGGWTESVLYNSGNGNPDTGLIFDKSGNLYGTTSTGGNYGLGSVFEITP
jgi:uncharacterized repeat protein (TIGR03803 family)